MLPENYHNISDSLSNLRFLRGLWYFYQISTICYIIYRLHARTMDRNVYWPSIPRPQISVESLEGKHHIGRHHSRQIYSRWLLHPSHSANMSIDFLWSISDSVDVGQYRRVEVIAERAEHKTARQVSSASAEERHFRCFSRSFANFGHECTLGGPSSYTRRMLLGEGTPSWERSNLFRIDTKATICCTPTALRRRYWLCSENNSSCSSGKL